MKATFDHTCMHAQWRQTSETHTHTRIHPQRISLGYHTLYTDKDTIPSETYTHVKSAFKTQSHMFAAAERGFACNQAVTVYERLFLHP